MVNGGLKWYSKVLETNIICPKTTTFVNEMFYPLEFKSRLAHQKMQISVWISAFFICTAGLEEGGLAVRQGKKVSGGHFFSPGESPSIPECSP